ncbi:hypothetical protein AGMMS49579_22380 [Spirochaetia bacterium]|nr:hypothetical protein AGMMS49579_22380 [Spirochaetia bacterium]
MGRRREKGGEPQEGRRKGSEGGSLGRREKEEEGEEVEIEEAGAEGVDFFFPQREIGLKILSCFFDFEMIGGKE